MKKTISVICLAALLTTAATGLASGLAFAEDKSPINPFAFPNRRFDVNDGYASDSRDFAGPHMEFGFKGGEHDGSGFRFSLPDMSKYEEMTDEERVAAMKEELRAKLEEQVSEGLITQEQMDHMLDTFPAGPRMEFGFKGGERDDFGLRFRLPDLSKYEGMTDEERAAAMKDELRARLEEQVSEGLITQEQMDHMLDTFPAGPRMEFGCKGGERDGAGLRFRLPDLSKYEGMTDEERAAAMTEDFKKMLEEMVANGDITQEQSDHMLDRFLAIPRDFRFPADIKKPVEEGIAFNGFPTSHTSVAGILSV